NFEASQAQLEAYEKELAARKSQEEIRQLEISNAELSDGSEDFLLIVPDSPMQDKLRALRENNRRLTESANQENETEPEFDEEKFPGDSAPFRFKDEIATRWLDRNGVDVYTGERFKVSPEQWQKNFDEHRTAQANAAVDELDEEKPLYSFYAMTEEEFEAESRKPFPRYKLAKQSGPTWNDSILHGLAGRIVKKASEYNESHPVGMLVDLLVSVGSIIGRGPYFNVGATKHYTNEFMARVGQSSKARKGTGRDAVDELLKIVDPEWFSNRIASGFASGEAIISRVRDEAVEMRHNPRTGGFDRRVVPGVRDKRLAVRE